MCPGREYQGYVVKEFAKIQTSGNIEYYKYISLRNLNTENGN